MCYGSADGLAKPVMLKDRRGGKMHTGRYWDADTREHTSGDGPGERAYSALPYDYDGDGDLDLIIGTNSGGLYVRENKGSATQLSFSEKLVDLDLKVPGGYAMPVAADWDGDGKTDLISGSQNGAIYWFRGKSKKKLKLRKAAPLVEPGKTKTKKSKRSKKKGQVASVKQGARAQVFVFDYDGDGDMDLLVGDNSATGSGKSRERHGWVWLYRRAGKGKLVGKR